MKTEILFIHSAGPQGHLEGSDFLITYIRKMLGENYAIKTPQMPDPENPHYDLWKEKLESELSTLHKGAILIGHSLGGSVLLKYLSEAGFDKSISGLFLIAVPYWGVSGWKVAEFELQKDFASRLPFLPHVFIYHSKDDEVVSSSHINYYSRQLPEAITCEVNHCGHLFSKGLPELITDIKKL